MYSAEQHLISSAVPTKNLKREIRRTISLTCSRVFHLDHGVHWSKGDLKCGIEHVRKALSDFAKISFHPGWIPDRFQDVDDWKFSFVHIDADWPEPTSESLAFFYPRIEAGGIIVCDDYGQSPSPGATHAVDHFLADKPEKMLMLPEGGGFLIVKVPTASPARLEQRIAIR